jgi:hypothetical protein
MVKPRPTDEEFEELKRRRDEAIREMVEDVCKDLGWDPKEVQTSSCHSICYCACPDGPCQHIWDGPEYIGDEGCLFSSTCSRCGAVAAYHDMRVGP